MPKLKTHKGATKRTIDAVWGAAASNNNANTFTRASLENRYLAKPTTPEEAAEYLAMEKLSFVMFRNAATNEINVVYPLNDNDGGVGLIEP